MSRCLVILTGKDRENMSTPSSQKWKSVHCFLIICFTSSQHSFVFGMWHSLSWCLSQSFLLAFSHRPMKKKGLQNTFSTIMIMKSTWIFIVLVTSQKHVARWSFLWLQGEHSGEVDLMTYERNDYDLWKKWLNSIFKKMKIIIMHSPSLVITKQLFVTSSKVVASI